MNTAVLIWRGGKPLPVANYYSTFGTHWGVGTFQHTYYGSNPPPSQVPCLGQTYGRVEEAEGEGGGSDAKISACRAGAAVCVLGWKLSEVKPLNHAKGPALNTAL